MKKQHVVDYKQVNKNSLKTYYFKQASESHNELHLIKSSLWYRIGDFLGLML